MALFLLHEQLTEYGTLLLFIYLGGGTKDGASLCTAGLVPRRQSRGAAAMNLLRLAATGLSES